METRFLQTLITVIETGSISETARRMNITPSAVVQRIKALEDEIGQPLILRAGHAMRPSPAATAALTDIHRLLAAERDLKSAAASDLDSGLLRIGVVQSVLLGILPGTLHAMHRNFPRIEIRILTDVSGQLYQAVRDREIDLAIITRPQFYLPKDTDWHVLRREKMVLLAPEDSTGEDPMQLLRQYPFIRYDRNYWGGRLVDGWLRKHKLWLAELYELNSLEAIARLVSLGVGVAVVPDWMSPWPEGIRLRKLVLPDAPEREIGIAWSRASNALPLIRRFVGEAEKIVLAEVPA
ncbi:LysR family transcriptional regulator [Acidisoma cellulosilytica]|uniref:LysR family transcriptional regulator n=1 Tax=Acidisoma cellulosilyticum TaxID=2802395 RepID=A0A963Z389_9PROT|nr:LysR family transcriptional regulator [Acidisoma cellulosilyticum]MCB8881090.1 LysR family transcriptional regulator [Acidisoma cellulosilyticum]